MSEFISMQVDTTMIGRHSNVEISEKKVPSFEDKSALVQTHKRPKICNLPNNSKSWQSVQLGSPPMKKYEQDFLYKTTQDKGKDKKGLMKYEQPQSLDCDGVTPMIKITPISDLESDSDSSMLHHLPVMDYLNPFCLQVTYNETRKSLVCIKFLFLGSRVTTPNYCFHMQL